jgi:hypothetical protein
VYTTLRSHLAEGVAALGEFGPITVAELSEAGLVIWEVRPDQNGTPRSRCRAPVPWSSLAGGDGVAGDEIRQLTRRSNFAQTVIVATVPAGQQLAGTVDWVRAAFPDAAFFECREPLGDLIREVIAETPLTQWYELVVLRRGRSGSLTLTGCLLFPPGARRGDRRPFTMECGPSDAYGTVFAVVANEQVRRFELISVESGRLAPGRYHVTAELEGPGVVRFDGLPAGLRPDLRSWPQLVASVPDRLLPPQTTHLVCVAEVSGARDQTAERLSRIQQLIDCAAGEWEDRLNVSLVCYGTHSFDRAVPDQPATVLAWASTREVALEALASVREQGAAESGYSRAAQLECALTEVAGRLAPQQGRPVLVTAGARPPFPARVDPRTEIIPCPRKRNWRHALSVLREHQGIVFGGIHDQPVHEEIWAELSADAFARLDAVSVPDFASSLGLLGPSVQYVPFPLISTEGD